MVKGLSEWQNSPRGTSVVTEDHGGSANNTTSVENITGPGGIPRLAFSRLSAHTSESMLFAPQAQRAPAGGVLLDDVMLRSGSPLQRAPSPSVSDGQLEAAGVLLEELSSLKGTVAVCGML